MVGQQSILNTIWRSRLVLRIAASLFFVILLVNALFSVMSLIQYRKDRLFDIEELGLYTLIPAIQDTIFIPGSGPMSEATASYLVSNTPISGLSYYNRSFEKIGEHGESVSIQLMSNAMQMENYYDSDNSAYEVIYRPKDLGVPYYIIARMDAENLVAEMENQIKLEIVIVLLLSLFVTIILIITLSKWFLDPIIYLYNRLTIATRNPENPPKTDKDFHDKTEIGRAIEAADILMTNNADSIRRIKAMAESEVNRLAYFDTLTGLPNRTSFLKTLKELNNKAREEGAR